jgi:hypothetical protein
MQVDHAVFTSLRSSRLDGYQLTAATAGITAAEARELTLWGPAHDSLLETAPATGSINFHTLSSGRCCVWRTCAAEAEYSGRGGARIETRYYLLSTDDFARFSNNAFRVIEAALSMPSTAALSSVTTGTSAETSQPPPLCFVGRAGRLDRTLLAELIRDPGPAALADLLDGALRYPRVGVAWRGSITRAVAGLINLLPVGCRTDLSFTTGLRYSARRPFKLIALPDDPALRKRAEKAAHVKTIDLDDPPTSPAKLGGWASVVREALVGGHLADLVRLIDPQSDHRQPLELSALAEFEPRRDGAEANAAHDKWATAR